MLPSLNVRRKKQKKIHAERVSDILTTKAMLCVIGDEKRRKNKTAKERKRVEIISCKNKRQWQKKY